jgi:predicted DNA-binding transcriptional regulator YafY
VAHSGRWYLTGFDTSAGQVRTFRVDRISAAEPQDGTFAAPPDFDPAQRVLSSIAEAPHRHDVSVLIQATTAEIRAVFPPTVAVLEEAGPKVRAHIRAERLDWIPPRLAALDRPFVIEAPAELRDLMRALADRLSGYAGSGPSTTSSSAPSSSS